jgi:hypothetical protein
MLTDTPGPRVRASCAAVQTERRAVTNLSELELRQTMHVRFPRVLPFQ